MKKKYFIMAVLFGYFYLLEANSQNQNYKISWSSFNMGFAESKTANTMIKSAVGQTFVGESQQLNTMVLSGFLADTLLRSPLVAVKDEQGLPTRFALAQNYPNPFNPSTTIHFEIPVEAHVVLKVYNMLGQEVIKVMDENKVAGRYDIQIDGTSLSSGVYFYTLETKLLSGSGDRLTQVRKMLLVK